MAAAAMPAGAAAAGLESVLESRSLFEQLAALTKTVGALPESSSEGGDYDYYRTTYSQFKDVMGRAGADLLDMGAKLVKQQSKLQNAKAVPTDVSRSTVIDQYNRVVDVIDGILESADVALDELSGRIPSALQSPVARPGAPALTPSKSTGRLDHRLMHAGNLRPQDQFADRIDNSSVPFVPRLLTKPHSLRKFDRERFVSENAPAEDDDEDEAEAPVENGRSRSSLNLSRRRGYPHPYEEEIRHIKYPAWLFTPCQEQIYLPLGQTKCTWVDTEAALDELIAKLEAVTEFAVDLEHHSYRSFQGFLCLMQLSTRSEDFLVDVLALRAHMHRMNGVFANPAICKVLHGADSDIVWLQRDFGIYIVNLFDTGQAARVLEMPSFGLAHLLHHYVNVEADKKYQLADWRIRPLPTEMARYAQEDTHYLLYIFDRLRNELLARSTPDLDRVRAVLRRSEEVALKRYEIELYDEQAYTNLLSKYRGDLSAQQLAVFKALYAWRDRTARQLDEGTAYILSNQPFFKLVAAMPTTAQRVVASLQPLPAFLRQHADEVAKVIAEAKQSGGAVQSTAAFPASFYLATELKAPAVPVPSAAVARFQGASTAEPFVPSRSVKIAPQANKSGLIAKLPAAPLSDRVKKSISAIHKTLSLTPHLSEYLSSYSIITSADLAEGKTARGVAMPAAGVFVAHTKADKKAEVKEEEKEEEKLFVLSQMRAAERAAASSSNAPASRKRTKDDSDSDSEDDSSSDDSSSEEEKRPVAAQPPPAKQRKAAEAVTPFDYANAKSAVKGVAGHNARSVEQSSFNPYKLADGKRGNKVRSKTQMRSGNRSATFRKTK